MLRKSRDLVMFFFAFWSIDLVINLINRNRDAWVPVISLDAAIPFVPGFIFFYTLYFPLVTLPLVILYRMINQLRMYVAASTIVMLVSYAVFLIWPTRLMRVSLETDSAANLLTMIYHNLVGPVNLFPSLHVSMLLLAMLVLLKFQKRLGLILLLPNLLSIVSVVLTKQHYILDLIAAIPLALAAWFFSRRYSARA